MSRNRASKSKYGQTSIKQQVAKIQEKLSAIHCNKNLYSMATSIKRLQSAFCHPKSDSFLFYTSIQWPVVSYPPEWLLNRGSSVIYRKTVEFVFVTSVCKMSGVTKDNDFSNRQLLSCITGVENEHTRNLLLLNHLTTTTKNINIFQVKNGYCKFDCRGT